MNGSDYKNFLSACKKAIGGEVNLQSHQDDSDVIASEVFRNKEYVKKVAADIRNKFLNSIDYNLITFDKNFASNGGVINWCIDYNDFLVKLDKVLQYKKIKKVNLFSSYLSKELGIERFIDKNEYSYDSESNDCVIFTPQFGIVSTGSLFLNFNSAYDMQLILGSKLKIFVLSICDFLFKPEEIEIFSHLYSIYSSGINFPYLTSLYTPSPADQSTDALLFLIDNGRSNVVENSDIRKILTCISCDACKDVCPVYKVIGDEPYNNVFTGPVANVILPFMENAENYKHLCFSCSSCGNCSAVCPVKIPVSELIIANRKYLFDNKLMDIKDERTVNSVSKFVNSRKKMSVKRWAKNLRLKSINNSRIAEEYKFEKSSFNQQYIQMKYGK